jgi:hypothetical protein
MYQLNVLQMIDRNCQEHLLGALCHELWRFVTMDTKLNKMADDSGNFVFERKVCISC